MSLDDIRSIVTCPKCLHVYDEESNLPQILTCGHTVCTHCVHNTHDNSICKLCSPFHSESIQVAAVNKDLVKTLQFYKQASEKSSIEPKPSYEWVRNNQEFRKYYEDVRKKVELIDESYQSARQKIDDDFDKVRDEINYRVEDLIRQLSEKKAKLLVDLDTRKNELLIDLKARYGTNKNIVDQRNSIKTRFEAIRDKLEENSKGDVKKLRSIIEELDALNSKLDDNKKLIPNEIGEGIVFAPSTQEIDIPLIGDLNYNPAYKLDLINKLENINNNFQHRLFDLNHAMHPNPICKSFCLLSKNKALVIYEKLFGKVKITFLKIVYFDGSVVKEVEIKDVGTLITSYLHIPYILLGFKKGERDYVVHMYDIDLKFRKDHHVKFEIVSFLMNKEYIFITRTHKDYVCEYNHDLSFRKSFGQIKNEKEPFYVKGEIVAITLEKIYVRLEDTLRILTADKGELIHSIVIDTLIQPKSRIFLDTHREKYIVYNGFEKIAYHNHKGVELKSNKLRNSVPYDGFFYTITGHFGFIDEKNNAILVI